MNDDKERERAERIGRAVLAWADGATPEILRLVASVLRDDGGDVIDLLRAIADAMEDS